MWAAFLIILTGISLAFPLVISDQLREIFALPQRYGGLGIYNMMKISDKEYEFSTKATERLKKAIQVGPIQVGQLNKSLKL